MTNQCSKNTVKEEVEVGHPHRGQLTDSASKNKCCVNGEADGGVFHTFEVQGERRLKERITSNKRILMRMTDCLCGKRRQEDELPRHAPKNKNQNGVCRKATAGQPPDDGLCTAQ